jgi:hypothetical protein
LPDLQAISYELKSARAFAKTSAIFAAFTLPIEYRITRCSTVKRRCGAFYNVNGTQTSLSDYFGKPSVSLTA